MPSRPWWPQATLAVSAPGMANAPGHPPAPASPAARPVVAAYSPLAAESAAGPANCLAPTTRLPACSPKARAGVSLPAEDEEDVEAGELLRLLNAGAAGGGPAAPGPPPPQQQQQEQKHQKQQHQGVLFYEEDVDGDDDAPPLRSSRAAAVAAAATHDGTNAVASSWQQRDTLLASDGDSPPPLPFVFGAPVVGVAGGATAEPGGGERTVARGTRPRDSGERSRALYLALFLTPESRSVLLAMVPPAHPLVLADHVTLAFLPSAEQLLDFPLGAEVAFSVLGRTEDSRVQAVHADLPAWLPPVGGAAPHVTVSVAVGTRPTEAGLLVRDALHRAAAAEPGAAGAGGGAGAYVALAEPLQLVARVGVRAKRAPSAGAGASGAACEEEGEVVVYSLEELEAAGCVALGPGALEAYRAKHAARIAPGGGGSGGGERPCLAALGSLGDGSPTATPFAPLPLQLPPAILPGSPGAAGGGWSPPACTASAVPDHALQLASPAGSTPLRRASERSGGSGGAPAPADDDTSSMTSESSGGSGVVQFRSAVRAGDYVALRPYLAADEAGGGEPALMQGFVREFACDEPFQPAGVLVVLDDNTIGFVAAVLDPGSDAPATARRAAAELQRRAGKGGRRRRAAAGASAGQLAALNPAASAASEGLLSEWALAAHDAGGDGVGPCSAQDARRDLQLWQEFEALQAQHGEALCGAILGECDHDFSEAIRLIRAQFDAPAAGGGIGGGGGGGGGGSPGSSGPASPKAQEGADEELVQQLALSLGLEPGGALQLARLVPDVSAERVVEALARHGGDACEAADALLADPHGAPGGAGAGGSPGREQALALDSLVAMFPSLQRETAALLLQEHGGDLDKAACAVHEMQQREMAAIAAAIAPCSPCNGSPRLAAAGIATTTTATASNSHNTTTNTNSNTTAAPLSEAEQLHMLKLQGLLQDSDDFSDGDGGEPLRAPFAAPRRSPPRSPQRTAQRQPPRPQAHATTGYGVAPARSAGPQQDRATKEAVDRLYERSRTLAKAAQIYLMAAQAQLANGDQEGFRRIRDAADKARADSRAASDEAQRLSWTSNNNTQMQWQVDLHGLPTSEALAKFDQTLQRLVAFQHPGGINFRVIVGQGHHSEDNVPKIKLGVLQYLQERGTSSPVEWEVDRGNPGVVNVFIPGPPGDGGAPPAGGPAGGEAC